MFLSAFAEYECLNYGFKFKCSVILFTSQNLQIYIVNAFQAITAGTCMVLSALIVILLQPVFAPAAFATFQSAAKAGGPAAAAVGRRLIQTELLSSAWTGFFAGCLHTLSGPDHLAALAPLSIGRTRMESAAVGALWGCGHDAGQVIFGLLFLLLKDQLHIEVIRTWGTRVVGITLLVIGAMGIREASEVPTPCVALENGECDVGVYEALQNPAVGKKKKIGFATFATGIVHGLQPDALMMVVPALALPSRVAGAAFLVMFLVGTVVAMGSYTVFIGSCSQALKDRIPRITEKLTWASSLVAIALGLAIIISQLFGYSLY
jgi:sulfite exporter TauE/SafE